MLTPRSILLAGLLVSASVFAASGADKNPRDHWSFRPITRPTIPTVKHSESVRTPVDAYLLGRLEPKGLSLSPPTDRATLLRRLSLDLTGLPPQPAETARFVAAQSHDAEARAVERLLASPHYGERWGKYWLDVAGYADSNGYFNADSDRPLAFRYRDYVVRAFNSDKPFDRFVQEQLAGDELSGYVAGKPLTRDVIDLFTATHFLRNSQDGSGESDGNPEEVRIDRATVLQGTLQITMNSLLGVTIQCCRCHEHKFEPIAHAEYYQLQSIFYPAFPAYDLQHWVKPKDRVREMPQGDEAVVWQNQQRAIDVEKAAARNAYFSWVEAHRPPESVLFRDRFEKAVRLHEAWWSPVPESASVSKTDAIGAVALDSSNAPSARIEKGALKILDGGGGDRWVVTRKNFDWKPRREGDWIQASFTLTSDRIDGKPAAERVAYFIAAHPRTASGSRGAGNLLIDGNPAGGAAVHVAYPGSEARILGTIGESGYRPGHRYGVRVTNVGNRKYRLEQIVDLVPEKNAITLEAADLTEGAFGFEFCCGRSFSVADLIVETVAPAEGDKGASAAKLAAYRTDSGRRARKLNRRLAELDSQRQAKPGNLACVTDLVQSPAALHVLKRGSYTDLGEPVVPASLRVVSDGPSELKLEVPYPGSTSSGRRLAFARWLTAPRSRAADLLARVTVNRIWQHHFGTGLVATPDNFGLSGTRPTHPELLEYLADEFRTSGWSIKHLHRLIVLSAAYRQSSATLPAAVQVDPDNRLLWRFPLGRLDAEAIRDSMLAVSGELTERMYGPYVPCSRDEDGAVVVREGQEGSRRRSVYLQQKRTQVTSFLELFDAPTIVNNCPIRGTSTVPLQSLALLNSTFIRARAEALAAACRPKTASPALSAERVRNAIQAAFGRTPTAGEQTASTAFLSHQAESYKVKSDESAWRDFCQMLLASNAFLYVE